MIRMRWLLTGTLSVAMAMTIGAQETAPMGGAPTKDARLAAVLGVILPGAGQVYTGETTSGLLVFGSTFFAFANSRCNLQLGTILNTCSLRDTEPWAAVGVGIWLAGAILAPINARTWNR